jgi:hypothetical protein
MSRPHSSGPRTRGARFLFQRARGRRLTATCPANPRSTNCRQDPMDLRRSSRCSRRQSIRSPRPVTSCSSRSGTAFGPSSFRSSAGDVAIQSRDLRPFDRYFPELHDALAAALPPSCVLDGEIVVATPQGLDFDALQQRIHPAPSRIARLARETPGLVRRVRPARPGRPQSCRADAARASGGAREPARRRAAAAAPDARDDRSQPSRAMARALRRRRTRRHRREADRRARTGRASG